MERVYILISRSGQQAFYYGDLIYLEGVPHVVFEHSVQSPDEGDSQRITVALDPQYLHPLLGWTQATHMYEMAIADPRPLH